MCLDLNSPSNLAQRAGVAAPAISTGDNDPVKQTWEQLATGVYRCRLAFLDVTVGLILGRDGAVLVDCGTTLGEARSIDADVRGFDVRGVRHLVLTHDHFDHILGSAVFADAAGYCAPAVADTIANRTDYLRAHALGYGAVADEIDDAIAALPLPAHHVHHAAIELGDRTVEVEHPGHGHTDHDLIVWVGPIRETDATVVFCGDLVEESGDPGIGAESDVEQWWRTLDRVLAVGGPDAVYVPGHGAVVDAGFVRRQQRWLRDRVTQVDG